VPSQIRKVVRSQKTLAKRRKIHPNLETKTMPYQTVYIVNAKGSGVGESAEGWTFTVDASIFTFSPIDNERLLGMVRLAEELSSWICDELRLHNASFDTLGSQLDMPVGAEDSRGQGFYFVHLDVEDVTMAKGDYRSRSDIAAINASMLAESEQPGAYSYSSGKVQPRMAFDLRMHISPVIRELISEGIKRFLARLAGR
jgi:hypothetical protein